MNLLMIRTSSDDHLLTRWQMPLRAVLMSFLLIAAVTTAIAAPGEQMTERTRETLERDLFEHGKTRIIVRLRDAAEPAASRRYAKAESMAVKHARRASIRRLQQRLLDRRSMRFLRHVKRFKQLPLMAMEVSAGDLDALEQMPDVASIEHDRLLRPVLNSTIPIIDADLAWTAGFEGNGQAVAVLDTGVDASHSFFGSRVVAEACFSSTYSPLSSFSFCPNGANVQTGAGAAIPCSLGRCDHGTHVAGIVAGSDGTYAGVAPQADIIAIQVFSEFTTAESCQGNPPCIAAYTSDIIEGLEHVLSLNSTLDVAAVNMSLGGSTYTSALACDQDNGATKTAIDNLRAVGITTVISSGNGGKNNAIGAPGCISSAVSVGATSDNDQVTGFSNSASWLSLLAPGKGVVAAVPGGGVGGKSGTSMSAPHAAGAIAVLREKVPTASVDQVLAALQNTGVPVFDGGNGFTQARIDVDDALTVLDASAPPVNLILDDDYAGTATGNFEVRTGVAHYAGRSRYSDGTGTSSFEFTPDAFGSGILPRAGLYRVYAWWSADNDAASDTVIRIFHSDSTTELSVDQSINGGRWNVLGEYMFNNDVFHAITISDEATSGGRAVADAVRFEYIDEVTAADVVLTLGVTETGQYGNNYGTDEHPTILRASFEGQSFDLLFSLTGYDIDFNDEVEIRLNGNSIGFLSAGSNNGLNGGDTFAISAAQQLMGTNLIEIIQTTPGWAWGVSELLIAEDLSGGGSDTPNLTLDIPDAGQYGNGYGSDEHLDELVVTFADTGIDIELSLNGYDIDFNDEIEVFLNGVSIGYLSAGPNNALNGGDSFSISAADQIPGTNEVRFVQRTSGWIWGVTNLLISEDNGNGSGEPPVIALSLGVVDPGQYGNNFGSNEHPVELKATFDNPGSDIYLSLNAYDIDFANEVEVRINGVFVTHLAVGPNNGLGATQTILIAQGQLQAGTNELSFVQTTPGWIWGVTNLKIDDNTGAPTVVLTPDATDSGQYGNNYGTNVHFTELVIEFESPNADVEFSLNGYDVDFADEIEVWVNGSFVGHLSAGPNNGLNAGDTFAIPLLEQLPGTNEIRLVQTTPGWIWGATQLLIDPL